MTAHVVISMHSCQLSLSGQLQAQLHGKTSRCASRQPIIGPAKSSKSVWHAIVVICCMLGPAKPSHIHCEQPVPLLYTVEL